MKGLIRRQYGMCCRCMEWVERVKSFYEDDNACVKMERGVVESLRIHRRTRQRCVMSTMAF